ncbi:MAG: MlaD family protein [Proteobacteria bacterium]|jgi:phospholipid/cholesterol/gamma-HCH transport system substrate-binding protein|nr:MlaD family protein [Pseudomonadota bacterium]
MTAVPPEPPPPADEPPGLPQPRAGAPLPDEVPRASWRSLRNLEVRAALLLILMAVLMAGSVLYLLWARGAFETTQALYLTTDDSDGVVVGMDMSFSGFPIGRVSRIELAEGATVRIQVDVPVKDAHWLRSSSVFTLEKGLVGAARLRAFTGLLDDPPLPPGAERAVLRGDVSAEIPKMVADARDVLQNLNRLTSAQSELALTMAQVRGFAERLNSAKGGLMAAITGGEGDGRRIGELLENAQQLMRNLNSATARVDGMVKRADQQLLGREGLVGDAQAAVRQLDGLLRDARQTLVKVDAVLTEVQGVAGNAREATDHLGDLRADVEASLRKVDALISEISGKWPFAPTEKEVKLP